MNGMKNFFHGGILAIWAVLGIAFSVKTLFLGPMPIVGALFTVGAFWLWMAAFAGVTTYILSKTVKPAMALVVHGLAFIVLMMIPRVFPLSLIRLGLDLLIGA